MGGVKTKWMLFWLISLSQNVASIGSLKDDSCTPKPAKLNACNTSQSDLMKSLYFRCAFFFPDTAKESSFHLLSSGLPWVSQTDYVHSYRPGLLLDQATWSPQAGTCSTGITQCTLLPRHSEEFKGEDDCIKWQAEKDGWKVRRLKLEPVGSPPRVLKS